MDLQPYIRAIPDFPTPGILFRDITPLLGDATAFKYVIDQFSERYTGNAIDTIVAIEARGFLFGGASRLQAQQTAGTGTQRGGSCLPGP